MLKNVTSQSVTAGLASGLLFALALPPFNLCLLGWIYPLPLIIVALRPNTHATLLAAYLCGLVAANQAAYGVLGFGTGMWLFLFLFCPLWIVLPVAAFLWVKKYISGVASLVCLPCFWVASEKLFMDVLLLPLDSGVTMARSPAALQLASYLGSAGLTFAIVLTSMLGARAVLIIYEQGWREHWKVLLVPSSIPLMCLLPGTISLPGLEDQQCIAKFEAAQPVISYQHSVSSWTNPAIRNDIRSQFQHYINQGQASKADMFIWPEGGSAFSNFRVGDDKDSLITAAHNSNRHFFISTMDFNEYGNKFNSLISIDPQGHVSKYDKLIPVIVAENDTTPGSTPGIVDTAWGKAGAMICFEVCFPHISRKLSAQNAAFLLVTTSDMAFGVSSLPELHLSTSILRAVENRRSVLHASNGGPSAIVDPYGRITKQTRLWDKTSWQGCVPASPANSFFTRAGYLFSGFCVISALALVIFATVRRVRCKQLLESPGHLSVKTILASMISGVVLSLLMALLSALLVAKQAAVDINFEQIIQSLQPSPTLHIKKDTRLTTSASRGDSVLAFVASYYGMELNAHKNHSATQIAPLNTSLEIIAHNARQLGFQAQTASGLMQVGLGREHLPVIIGFGSFDYAVLLISGDDLITLFIPDMGVGSLTLEQFNTFWDGRILRLAMPYVEFSSAR